MPRRRSASSYFVQRSNGFPDRADFLRGGKVAQAGDGAAKSGNWLNLACASRVCRSYVASTLLSPNRWYFRLSAVQRQENSR
jgi:hypothetical protein